MLETFNDGDLDRVSHLSQVGFSYTEDEPCMAFHFLFTLPYNSYFTGLQFALSPSYSSAVQIRNDGKVKWKRLDSHMGDIGSSKDDRKLLCSTPV